MPYNQYIVAHLGLYPLMDVSKFIQQPIHNVIIESLNTQLSPLMQTMDEQEKINFLLHLCKCLCFKTDGEQFGYENHLFAMESIYYPYADCEDRSLFFARLVKRLLGNDVMLMDYPGHVATAVAIDNINRLDSYRLAKKNMSWLMQHILIQI